MEPRPPRRPQQPAGQPAPTYPQQGADPTAPTQWGAGTPPPPYQQPPQQAAPPPPPTGPTYQGASYPGSPPGTGTIEFPVVPKDQRGRGWVVPLLLGLVLAGLVAAAGFGIARYISGSNDGDDQPDTAQVVPTAAPTVAGEIPTATGAAAAVPTATMVLNSAQGEPTSAVAVAPPAKPTATGVPAQPTAAPQPTEPETTEAGGSSVKATDAYFLPAESVGDSFQAAPVVERSEEEVAAALGADGAAKLEQWQWRENKYIEYSYQADATDPTMTSFISISVNRFRTEEDAATAMLALTDIAAGQLALSPAEVETIGDQTTLLVGPSTEGNLAYLYYQDGRNVVRVSGFSVSGDPQGTVTQVAKDSLAYAQGN